jgi:hypothetical protein
MYRIKKYDYKGWLVEKQEKTWYGKKYWKTVFNKLTDASPLYFYDYEAAHNTIIARVKYEITENSK